MLIERVGVVDGVGLAWRRVRAMVPRPFAAKRALALMTVGSMGTVGLQAVPMLLAPWAMLLVPAVRHWLLPWACGAAVVTVLAAGFLYLGSRVQVTVFALVLAPLEGVGEAWRGAGEAVWRWVGLQLCVLLPMGVVVFSLLATPVRRIAEAVQTPGATGTPQDPKFVVVMLAMELWVVAAAGCVLLASSLLSDFALPFLVVEGSSGGEALRSGWALVRADGGAVAGYVGLVSLLALGAVIAQNAVAGVVGMCAALILGGVGLLGWWALHTAVSSAVLVVGGVVLYAGLFGIVMVASAGVLGASAVFLRAYAVCFVGGRYEALGRRLRLPEMGAPPPPLPGS